MSSERRLRSCLLAAALSLCTGGALAQAGEGGTARCTAQQPWPPRFTLEYTVVASRGGLRKRSPYERRAAHGGPYIAAVRAAAWRITSRFSSISVAGCMERRMSTKRVA